MILRINRSVPRWVSSEKAALNLFNTPLTLAEFKSDLMAVSKSTWGLLTYTNRLVRSVTLPWSHVQKSHKVEWLTRSDCREDTTVINNWIPSTPALTSSDLNVSSLTTAVFGSMTSYALPNACEGEVLMAAAEKMLRIPFRRRKSYS